MNIYDKYINSIYNEIIAKKKKSNKKTGNKIKDNLIKAFKYVRNILFVLQTDNKYKIILQDNYSVFDLANYMNDELKAEFEKNGIKLEGNSFILTDVQIAIKVLNQYFEYQLAFKDYNTFK